MLKDADHSYFAGVYIVCGYTDLRFGTVVTDGYQVYHKLARERRDLKVAGC